MVVEEFLEARKNHGDEELKARDYLCSLDTGLFYEMYYRGWNGIYFARIKLLDYLMLGSTIVELHAK